MACPFSASAVHCFARIREAAAAANAGERDGKVLVTDDANIGIKLR